MDFGGFVGFPDCMRIFCGKWHICAERIFKISAADSFFLPA